MKVKPSKRKVDDELALVKMALKSVFFYMHKFDPIIFLSHGRSSLGLGLFNAVPENSTTDDADNENKPRGPIVVCIFIEKDSVILNCFSRILN